MGIKKFFKTKPPSEEEIDSKIVQEMNENGIPVKSSKKKQQLFQAYSKYANDKNEKKVYAPKGYEEYGRNSKGEKVIVPGSEPHTSQDGNPYQSQPQSQSQNPYSGGNNGAATTGNVNTSNPYATMTSNGSYGSNGSNPYGAGSSNGNASNSNSQYGSNKQQNNYGKPQGGNPYGSSSRGSNGYGSSSSHAGNSQGTESYGGSEYGSQYGTTGEYSSNRVNPYGKSSNTDYGNPAASYANKTAVAEEEDLNELPDNSSTRPPSYRQQQIQHPRDQGAAFDFEDLNEMPLREEEEQQYYQQQQEELQQTLSPEELEDMEKQRQEDEEVEGIKNQIRYTKQESVASTRNTLRMAREAEESGKNTMGMLGSQSETLYNVERNLDLAKTQDRIAKEKVSELRHYNRNILKPNVQNPFTKSKRLREKEERIKNDRLQSKLIQEQQRRELSNSTNRIKSSLNDREEAGDSITSKYKREKYLDQAKRYQFENDSEDDEMENEIGENVDEIGKIAGRLKRMAMNQGEEIDRQNYRLRNIDEDMSELDINVHLNTTRLSGTR